jgi:hypothetical protein
VKAATFLCLAVLLAAGAMAHSVWDLDDWMGRIDDSSQDLQRHIASRDVSKAQASARDIEELYALMEEFFARRDDGADAVRWSRAGREFAQRAQTDLIAGRFSAAKRNALAIAHDCRDCHDQYKPL